MKKVVLRTENTPKQADKKVHIEFTQHEVNLLGEFIMDMFAYSTKDLLDEEYGDGFYDALLKIVRSVEKPEPEMVYMPASMFPSELISVLEISGLVRRVSEKEMEEAMRHKQSGTGK